MPLITKFDLSAHDRESIAFLRAKASWFILEAKYLYYWRDCSPVPDHTYDQIEKLYEATCTHLGDPPTATDMVGFDRTRPACGMVIERWEGREPDELLPKAEELMKFVEALSLT